MKAVFRKGAQYAGWFILFFPGQLLSSGTLNISSGARHIPENFIQKIHHHYNDEGRRLATVVFGPGAVREDSTVYIYDERRLLAEQVTYAADYEVVKRRITSYNRRGQVMEQTKIDEEGRVLERNTYRYDDNGRPTEWRLYEKNDRHKWTRRYLYDKKGNRIEERWLDPRGILSKLHVFAYHESGLMAGQNVYGRYGEIKWRCAYDYDSHGRRIAVRWYDEDDELQWVRTSRWDADGNIKEQRRYNAWRRFFSRRQGYRLEHRKIFSYDDRGNRTQQRVYDNRGRMFWAIEKGYDQAGNLVSYVNYDHRGRVEYRYEIAYNEAGRQTAWRWYEGTDELVWKRLYIYDAKGRLVQEIIY